MSLESKLNTAKQVKNKARAVKSAVRTAKGSRGGGKGGKNDKKKFPKGLIIALVVLAIVGIGAAWHFGLLDDILNPPEATQDERQVVSAEGEIRVHFIDVGQADGILIEDGNNAVLIDAGARNGAAIIVPYIQALGIDTLDVVVGTHPHLDHIGGMPGVLNAFNIGEVWMPNVTHTTRAFENFIDAILENDITVHYAQAGDTLSAGLIQMTAVHPRRTGYSSLNDYTVVLHMRHGNTAFLFTGDAEGPSDREILEDGWDIASTVMLAGHHGSRTSSSEELIDAISPDIAVISVGEGNKYGHPHQVVLDRFYERGIEVLRTDLEGTIILVTDGSTVRRETP